ncbi:hypothetical protein ADK61_02095 [Streptomyces sp. XY66]|uniref:hypothetical protein n=1 Tax=Streptomyces sp. XY66 TaxID=1415563 RepID=UPI0006AF5AE6|nr:hypothetical protein [Streptomyces sp. XY66]KOU89045.1 hypothetical protein ADK61_02095 [Streptomyces sp. XY66]
MRTTVLRAAAAVTVVGALTLTQAGCSAGGGEGTEASSASTSAAEMADRAQLVRELKATMAEVDVMLDDPTQGSSSERSGTVPLVATRPEETAVQGLADSLAALERTGWRLAPSKGPLTSELTLHQAYRGAWTLYAGLGGEELGGAELKPGDKIIHITAIRNLDGKGKTW